MSRIRTIKPEFWQSRKVARVPRETRFVFIGLWNEADDEGRLLGSPKRLAGALFPNDDDVDADKMDWWLAELERAQLIQRYEVSGTAYIAIPGFGEHQKIDKRWASRLPPPPSLAEHSERLAESPERPAQHSPPDMSFCSDMSSCSESGSESAPPAPAPRPLSGEELSEVRRRNAIGGKSRGVVGLVEQEHKPKDLAGLIARHGVTLAQRWGPDLAPDLATKLGGLWGSYSANYDKWGPADALARLESVLAKDAKEQRDRQPQRKPQPGEYVPPPPKESQAARDERHREELRRKGLL